MSLHLVVVTSRPWSLMSLWAPTEASRNVRNDRDSGARDQSISAKDAKRLPKTMPIDARHDRQQEVQNH